MDIRVVKQSDTVFKATVGEHVYTVTVDKGYIKKFLGKQIPPKKLIEASFDFLLEREPPEAILKAFNLKDISRYFPEYESQVVNYLYFHMGSYMV